jgi:hypothetical protein
MEVQVIQQRIYTIRNQRIMLDFDLAELYEVETRVFNQAIKRNIESFPEDFMFRLSAEEWRKMSSSQIVMMGNLPRNRTGKYLPYVFTEHGVSMAASVLKSSKARQMNIAIVRAFVALRKFALQYGELLRQIHDLREEFQQGLIEHDVQLAAIYDTIETLLDKKVTEESWKEREPIGFKNSF